MPGPQARTSKKGECQGNESQGNEDGTGTIHLPDSSDIHSPDFLVFAASACCGLKPQITQMTRIKNEIL